MSTLTYWLNADEIPEVVCFVDNASDHVRARFTRERTCHNTWDVELTGRLRFACSECGSVSLEIAARYCPICGAAVVDA